MENRDDHKNHAIASDHDTESPFGRFSEINRKRLTAYKSLLYQISILLQYIITTVIIIAIILSLFKIPNHLRSVLIYDSGNLILFLKYVINTIIALELVHVLCHQTIDTVVEILVMAITREIIITELEPLEILIGVIAIALLFVVRKYLFIPQIDHDEAINHSEYAHRKPKSDKKESCAEPEKSSEND